MQDYDRLHRLLSNHGLERIRLLVQQGVQHFILPRGSHKELAE